MMANGYPIGYPLFQSYSKMSQDTATAQGGSGLANLRRVVVQFADLASWAKERKGEFHWKKLGLKFDLSDFK